MSSSAPLTAAEEEDLASNVGGFTLAWSPGGGEVWCGRRVSCLLSGRKRTVAHFAEGALAILRDIARDGRALVVLSDWRRGIAALPGETRERELSWFGNSKLCDLSRGPQVLFDDGTETISGVYI